MANKDYPNCNCLIVECALLLFADPQVQSEGAAILLLFPDPQVQSLLPCSVCPVLLFPEPQLQSFMLLERPPCNIPIKLESKFSIPSIMVIKSFSIIDSSVYIILLMSLFESASFISYSFPSYSVGITALQITATSKLIACVFYFFLNASYSLILIPFSFVFYKLLARDFINTEANYHTDRSTVPYENLPLSGTRRSILFPRLISFVLMSSSKAT